MSTNTWVKFEEELDPAKCHANEEVDEKKHSSKTDKRMSTRPSSIRSQNSASKPRSIGKRQFSSANKQLGAKTIRMHRSARATDRQIQGLIDLMALDGELANGYVLSSRGRREAMNRWVAIAKKLNYDNYGAPKTVLQWQKVWHDLKRRTRHSVAAQQAAQHENRSIKPLTLTEERVAKIIERKVIINYKKEILKKKHVLVPDDDQLPGPQNLNYVNCDESTCGDELQLETFPGWSEAPSSPSPPQRLVHQRQGKEMSNNFGVAPINSSHSEEMQDPFASTTQRLHSDMPTHFMERLLLLEESRQRTDAQREEHRVWCDKRFAEMEEHRQTLERRRLELEESRLQQDQRRLEVDKAMYAAWQEFLSKK